MKEYQMHVFNETTPYQYLINMKCHDGKTGRELNSLQIFVGSPTALNKEQCDNLAAGLVATLMEGVMQPKPGDQIGFGMDALFDEDSEILGNGSPRLRW